MDDRYTAGLFDGEGFVRIAKWQKPDSCHVRYQVIAGIGMTYWPIIESLRDAYGGSLHINDHSKRNPKARPQYAWYISSRVALEFFRKIRPYLIVKADEVDLAVELQTSIDEWKFKLGSRFKLHERRDEIFAHRAELYRRIYNLKHRTFVPYSVMAPKAKPPAC